MEDIPDFHGDYANENKLGGLLGDFDCNEESATGYNKENTASPT